MKYLIAIKSCRRDCSNGFNQAVRDTWLKDCVIDYRFFVGHGEGTLSLDEEPLDCGDAYLDLPAKTRAIFNWALARGYDYTFLADTDTYVNVPKLLVSGFQDYDLVGQFNGPVGVPDAVRGQYAWVSGGAGYWVSSRAMALVVETQPDTWAEDMWVGQVIGAAVHRGDLTAGNHEEYGDDNNITSHFCSKGMDRTFNTAWMFRKHEEKR